MQVDFGVHDIKMAIVKAKLQKLRIRVSTILKRELYRVVHCFVVIFVVVKGFE